MLDTEIINPAFSGSSNAVTPFCQDISCAVEQISLSGIEGFIRHLTAFSTRFAFSDKTVHVREWIYRQFVAMGYTDVVYQDFVLCDSLQKNVICSKTGKSNRVLILCAHYDSTARSTVGWDWQTCPAPGANDNASGMAAMLEIACILKNIDMDYTIRFIAFAGEEQNMSGSRAYAEHALANAMDISLVINLDEIGYPDDAWSIVIGEDQGNHTQEKNAASNVFAQVMAQAAVDYTGLNSKYMDIWASDHMPFNSAGYAVIGVCQAGRYSHSHEVTDTCDNIDIGYVVEVTRMVLATMMHIAWMQQDSVKC